VWKHRMIMTRPSRRSVACPTPLELVGSRRPLRSRDRRPRPALGGLLVTVAAVSLAACGSPARTVSPSTTTRVSAASTTPTTTSEGAGEPPAIPTNGAYLGAWLHPTMAAARSAFAVEQQTIPSVTAVTGRQLGILHIYSSWSQPAPVTDLAAVSTAGSIPLLDWGCGDGSQAIASGADDQLITAYAHALKSFGKPVLLRWCWEMNLVALHPDIGGPSEYVAAWIHIWNIFHQQGVTNVSFVWCPGVSGVDPTPYYPGDQYVDWIGFDGYDRTGSTTFTELFGGSYIQWVGHGKPMMVAETGSRGPNQAAYLESIGTGMPALPAFKAVVYFDASGPAADWALVGGGLTAFGALARQPYFNPH
jgi:hypothetical protein